MSINKLTKQILTAFYVDEKTNHLTREYLTAHADGQESVLDYQREKELTPQNISRPAIDLSLTIQDYLSKQTGTSSVKIAVECAHRYNKKLSALPTSEDKATVLAFAVLDLMEVMENDNTPEGPTPPSNG